MAGGGLPGARRRSGRRPAAVASASGRRSARRIVTAMADTLTITDNRTGQHFELPIEHGSIRAMDLRQIRTGPDDFGLMTYDPAFQNTAACRSRITYIDGDKGILRYRGYPIDVLAQHCTYLEVAYLLLFGNLPNAAELKTWVFDITHHTMLHETT